MTWGPTAAVTECCGRARRRPVASASMPPVASTPVVATKGQVRLDRRLPYTTRVPLAGWVIASVALLVLALALPVMFAGVRGASFANPALTLSMAITVYGAVKLARILRAGREAWVELTFWAFVYLWLGLAASAQIIADRFPIPFQSFDQDLQVRALTGIIIGLVAYEVGHVVAHRHGGGSRLGRRLDRWEFAPRKVWLLAALGIVYPLYSTVTTGLAVRFSSRSTATNVAFGTQTGDRVDLLQNKAGGLIQVALLWVPAFLGLYLLLYLYRRSRLGAPLAEADRRWSHSRRARRLIVVLILVNVLVNNPQSNPRARFAGVVIALAIAWFPTSGPARFRAGAVALLGLTIIVFPYAGVFRYDQRAFSFAPLSEQLSASPDYSMFQQELNGLLYTDRRGYAFGRQMAGAVLAPVPRALWPEKPIDTGNLVSRTQLINASSDLWTEANLDFGFAGIAVVFLGYGFVSRLFDDAYRRRDRTRATVVGAAVPLFAAFQILLVRGALQPVIGELLPVAVGVALCLRTRRSVPTEQPSLG